MQEIKDDLKAIRSDVAEIRVEITKNTVSLEHHIKRSDASEARLAKLEYALIGLLVSVVGAALVKWLIS